MEHVLQEHAERLQLGVEARAEIDRLSRESHEEKQRTHVQLRALHDEMRELLGAEEPDETLVLRQAERIGALETELAKQRYRSMLRIRALLTPEQRRELVEIHRERQQRKRGEGPRP